ncbi:MAG: ribosome silencing factor [Bacteroidota bacterium]|jgi:ribosome-associated protein
MAKTPGKKPVGKVKKAAPKKAAKKAAKKSSPKKVITEKERALRAANLIANSEKKGSLKSTKRPKKTATKAQTTGLLESIVEGMKEKKAKNITVLNLTKLENRVCDYFVICDADSKTHVNSIADSVEDTVLKLTKEKSYHSEGQQNGEWILIDYINIVAHVFLKEMRDYYNIEALWGDAEFKIIED